MVTAHICIYPKKYMCLKLLKLRFYLNYICLCVILLPFLDPGTFVQNSKMKRYYH